MFYAGFNCFTGNKSLRMSNILYCQKQMPLSLGVLSFGYQIFHFENVWSFSIVF